MWYVVQVRTGDEEKCCRLCRHQIDSSAYRDIFVPKYIQKRRYQGIWHEKCTVLFPSYIFVDTDQIDLVAVQLQKLPCMAKIVSAGDEILPIREEEQQYLENMMDENRVVQYSTGLMIGNRVWIMEGALRNYEGYIRKINRHRRVAELGVSLFGRETPVEVGLEVIQKVTEEEFQDMKQCQAVDPDIMTSFHEDQADSQMVEVITGIFEGMTGQILHENKKKKELTVSLELFGKLTPVVFSQNEVCSIKNS